MKDKDKKLTVFLMTGLFFLVISGTDIYIASLPKMAKDFAAGQTEVNLTLSLFTVGMGVGLLFAGVIGNRFGRKFSVLFGSLTFSVCAFLIAISPYLWIIIILRFIQAVGGAFNVISSRQVFRDIMNEHEQVKANAIVLSGLIISPAISPVIGAFLSDTFGWRSCFVFSGILGIILAILAFKKLSETNTTPIEHLPSLKSFLMEYGSIIKNNLFVSMTLIYACTFAAYFAFIGISSYLYITDLKISPIIYSYIYILLAAAYLVGNQFLFAFNRQKMAICKVISIGTISTMLGTIIVISALLFTSQIVIGIIITIGVLFMRATSAMINPTTQVRLLNYFKEKGGSALGLTMSIGFAFSGLSIFIVSFFKERPLLGLIIVSFVFSAIALITLILSKKLLNDRE